MRFSKTTRWTAGDLEKSKLAAEKKTMTLIKHKHRGFGFSRLSCAPHVVNSPLSSLQCRLEICIESSCKYNRLLLNFYK